MDNTKNRDNYTFKILKNINDNKFFISCIISFLLSLFNFLYAYLKSIYYKIPIYYFYTIFSVKISLTFIPFILTISFLLFITWPFIKKEFLKKKLTSIEKYVSIFTNVVFLIFINSSEFSEYSDIGALLKLCNIPLLIILLYNIGPYIKLFLNECRFEPKPNNLKYILEVLIEEINEVGLIHWLKNKFKSFFWFLFKYYIIILFLLFLSLFLLNPEKVSKEIFQTKKSYELLIKSKEDTTGKAIITIYGDQYVVMDFNIKNEELQIASETFALYHKSSKQINDSLIKNYSEYKTVVIE